MRPCSLYILIGLVVAATQGLKCRLEQDTKSQEEFEDIVRICIRKENDFQKNNPNSNNNKNNRENTNKNNNRNDSRNKSQERKSTTEKYGKEDEDYDYDYEYESKRNDKNRKTQKGTTSQNNNRYQNNRNDQNNKQYNINKNQGSRNNTKNLGSPLESIESLNKENYIDKSNAVHVLTHKVRSSNLREFIEDSVNECFDVLERQNSEGKCEDTKNFALCLEEKGKNNCEDWDVTNKNKNSNNGKNNSNQDKTYTINNNQGYYNNNDGNNDRPMPGSSYYNRDQDRQNRYSNNRYNSDERQNNTYYNHQSNRDRNKHNTSNNYYNDKSNNGGNSKQDDESEEEKKFPNYFQTRG